VRSVTAVNETLLAGSAVRFVGTATIGVDHVDLNYLQQHHIAFASAPGCNAIAAAEYVISALLVIAERQGFPLREKTVGIIGCGNVGSQVLSRLQALGVSCLIHDPPLQEQGGVRSYVDLDTVLTADIITLHVPLTKTGRYPTYHLVNADLLSKLRDDVIFINTSRGAVVDEKALLAKLVNYPKMTAILDVWHQEPQINLQLLQQVTLGTPHIAGYSFDGKVRGMEMIYHAACNHFQQQPLWRAENYLPPPPLKRLTFSPTMADELAVAIAVFASYDIRRDDAALRRVSYASAALGEQFDRLRKHYPLRREFHSVEIEMPKEKEALVTSLQGLGFRVTIS
jgi:erythronate-4-phosphate dehydrogenase